MNTKMSKNGLTVIEVLFAMVIVLVGMVGIATIIPFAGRQAADSYAITHGLVAGENTLAIFKSKTSVQPRLEAPWQLVDDVSASDADCSSSWFVSMRDLYNHLLAVEANKNPALYTINAGDNAATQAQKRLNISMLQNRIISLGFCVDPLFWGYQPRPTTRIGQFDAGVYRRTRFPFYHELCDATNLTLMNASLPGTPRLIRVSFRDPLAGLDPNGRNGWLRLPASLRMASAATGDVQVATPDSDKSLGPVRATRWASDLSLIESPTSASPVSWMATVTPTEGTQIIKPDDVKVVVGALPSEIGALPEAFDVAVVVFNRRDVRASLDPATGIIPSSERLTYVSAFGQDALVSGTFDIELSADSRVDPKIRVGDWLMLSRNIHDDPTDLSSPVARQRHRWYRIINLSGTDTFPRRMRVSGAPWDRTQLEVETLLKNGVPAANINNTSIIPLPTTVATLVKDVVQVYERTIELKMD